MAWRSVFDSAVANRANSPASVLVIGDSLTEGQGASTRANRWLDLFRNSLRTQYPVSGVTGGQNYMPAFYGVYSPDSTWGSSGITDSGTTANITWPGNLGYRGVQLSASASRTFTVTGTSVDIWYMLNGGTMSYKIDGGTATNINTAGTYANARVTSVSLGSAGSHTVQITSVSGVCYFSGLTVYNGDETKGVRVYDSGHTGWLSSDPLSDSSNFIPAMNFASPDLVIIELGLNDAGSGVSAATFQTNLQALVTAVKGLTKLPSILIVAAYQPSSGNLGGANWSNFVAAMAAVAAADPNYVGFLNLTAAMPVADTTGTGYYSTDGLHPNNTGHAYIANLVTQAITSITSIAWFGSYAPDVMDQLWSGASFSVAQTSTPTLGGTLVAANNSAFRLRGAGGWAFGTVFPDTLMYKASTRYPNTWGDAPVNEVDFIFTGQRFEVYFKYLTGTCFIRVSVNGQRLTNLMQATGATSSGSRHYYRVDLGQTVTAAVITLEIYSMGWGGVAPEAGASITGSLPAPANRIIIQGDSITNGSGMNVGGGSGTYALRLAKYMGWEDVWIEAIGGTGYSEVGTSVNIADSARINDVTTNSPTMIIIWAGYNDGVDITTNATSVITQYQAALPGVPIYIIGSYASSYPASPAKVSRDLEAEAVAQTKGCYFISPITGRIRNTAGTLIATVTPLYSSSADITAYIGTDAVHPTDIGHNYIAKWLYEVFLLL